TSQMQHMEAARQNQQLRSSVNHGQPAIAATSRPGAFGEPGVMKAKEAGHYDPPRTETSTGYPGSAVHPKELPANSRLTAPNTGDAKQDKKYQQQQDKLYAKQEQERQQLQQKQEQEHQRLSQQQASPERTQQLERQHQQQTEQMAQRHYQQQTQLSQHQQAHPSSPKGKP
ncbi:MAG TPA: hypothetical protein VLX60_06950, partial [Terriglobales bacterium]|nr:hypothetical protein [Terriglobales bacterium]